MKVKQMLLAALCSGLILPGAEPVNDGSAAVNAGESVSQYLIALPHIAYGGEWRTQIIIGNTSATPADVTLRFFRSDGSPLTLAIGGAAASERTVTVPAHGAQTIEPDWQGISTTAGWVGLIYANPGIKVQGVFLWHNSADPADKYIEATAPIVARDRTACIIPMPSGDSPLTMPFDETQGRFSGYGFANTANTAVMMGLTFYAPNGQLIGQYSEQLPPFGHSHFLLRDKVPAVANSKGNVRVSGQGIVPLGFRFTPHGTFTTWLP
jgi:hypothetical protein